MGISLKNIAESLNLSKTTVSWVLSGQGESKGFSDATIQLVKAYANEVGYRPNLVARSLSLGSTKTFGLIIPAIGDTFYAQMTQAVEKQAQQYGYVLIVCSSEGDGARERQLIQTLRAQQVGGLIIAPAKTSQDGINGLIKDKFPFVLIDRYFPKLPTNYVIVDNEQSSSRLVDHLINQGCRHIAAITTDTHLLVMTMRINGYSRALQKAGLELSPSLCIEVDRATYMADITVQLDRLFQVHPDVDGFFFTTHYLAIEAMRYFIKHGIDYHNKLKFACFHTTVALDILAPDMAVSLMPIDRMGATAVDILMENVANKKTFRHQEIVLNNTFCPKI